MSAMPGKKRVKNNNNTNVDNSNSSVVNTNSSIVNNNSCVKNEVNKICGYFFLTVALFLFCTFCAFSIQDIIFAKQAANPMLEFQINSVEVSSMKLHNVSNDYYSIIGGDKKQHLMADLEFHLTLKNKEGGLMYFNPMEVSLEYDPDEVLSSTILEPYFLVEDQHQLQFGMQIKDADAHLQNRTVDSISGDLSDQNVVQFALKGKGHCVHWRRGVLYNCGINLLCEDIKVQILPAIANNFMTGSMIVSPLLCKYNSDCHLV